jgi:HNH endonuclease
MRGGEHVDKERTTLKQEIGEFLDKRSRIRLDGKMFLFGEDIHAMRHLVLERDGHRCVGCGTFHTCQSFEMHHRLERSKGGDDSLDNLEVRCPTGTVGCPAPHRGIGGIHA